MDITRALQRLPVTLTPNLPRQWDDVSADDQRLLIEFLHARASKSEHTYRRYQRELARLATFLNKEFRAVTAADLREYQRFLLNPPTAFIGTTSLGFEPMGKKSVDDAFRVVSAFYTWLVNEDVITRNPTRNVPKLADNDDPHQDCRYFDDYKWRALWDVLDNYGDDGHNGLVVARLRFSIALQYGLGLRVSEMTACKLSDVWRSGNSYRIKILGKGKKLRTLTLPDFTLTEIDRYRQTLRLPSSPSSFEPLPFLPRINPVRIRKRPPSIQLTTVGISDDAWQQTFSKLMERLYRHCNKKAPDDYIFEDTAWQEEWRHLSPHSLRHTRLTHLAQQGMGLLELQRFAGHTKADTTAIYYHPT